MATETRKDITELLNILGIRDKEDVITNLLAYCINADADFGRCFIESVCKSPASKYLNITAKTRISTSAGIPDLVIIAKDSDAYDLFVVENKIKAEGRQRSNTAVYDR